MIELRRFQESSAIQIAKRYVFFASHKDRPGTRRLASPFFQALSAITGAGKTPILAETVSLIRNELSSEPIILWMSKARAVVTQTFNNFEGGKYSSLLEGFRITQIKDLRHEMISDGSSPLLVLTTTGLFNNKDQEEGDLRIYRRAQDEHGEKSIWERLIERLDGQSRRPLIIVYDEGHNLSEQQTDILKELEADAWLLASGTIRLPAKFQATVVQPVRAWVVGCASEADSFGELNALREERPDADLFMTTAVDSNDVVEAGLIKSAIQFDGTTAPMERSLDLLLERRDLILREIDERGLSIRPKCIYVCRTNITDDGQQDDPDKPFAMRNAPPIKIWRYLVEQKKLDPKTIAIYADLKFAKNSKPEEVVHFSRGEDDFDNFQEGNFEHIIFNLSLQEGWDDPECYLAYIDKSMGSTLQVQQIIGRVLRQPAAKHYDSALMNSAHFFLRVDSKNVFMESLAQVKAKLDAEGASIAISASFAAGGKPSADEVLPRSNLRVSVHDIYVEKSDAQLKIERLLGQFPTFAEGSTDTLGEADNAQATIRLNAERNAHIAVDWAQGGHTNPVRLRWLLNAAIRANAPQALKVSDLKDGRFDVRVQVRSKADLLVKKLAQDIATAYFDYSDLAYEDSDEYPFGPMRVVREGSHKFENSIYPVYGKMNSEELAFAKALDKNGVTWHRNPSPGGFSIPLLTPGDTANFFPDFLAWKSGKVFALDTKGKHLVTDAIARKMFDIQEDGKTRLHVRFIVKGRQDAIGAKTADKHGYTIWRTKSNSPKAFFSETIEAAVSECLK